MPTSWLFWLSVAVLVAVALAFVVPALLRRRAPNEPRAAEDAALYRQQIEELQSEVEHGELAPEDAAAERSLAWQERFGDGADQPSRTSRGRLAAIAVAVLLPLVALATYFAVGRPGSLDSEAPEQGASDDGGTYLTRLEAHLARQPRDARGWVLLGRAQADRTEYKAAAASFQRALDASEKVAKDPGVLCEYADALGMAQGGRLDGRPAELIAQALAIDPQHPVALEMAGSAAYGDGRYDDALRYWRQLLAQLPAGDDRLGDLKAAIARAERKAAVSLPR